MRLLVFIINNNLYGIVTDFVLMIENLEALKELQELSRKSLNSTQTHLEQVQKNFEVGLAKKSDVLQWQVKLQNDKTSLNEIENNLKSLISLAGEPASDGEVSLDLRIRLGGNADLRSIGRLADLSAGPIGGGASDPDGGEHR